MARQEGFRRAPRAALVAWQSVALSAVVSVPVAAAPLVVGHARRRDGETSGIAGVPPALVSGMVLVRLLWSGHTVGTRLRAASREHRLLVDALGEALDDEVRVRHTRHPRHTACLDSGAASS